MCLQKYAFFMQLKLQTMQIILITNIKIDIEITIKCFD